MKSKKLSILIAALTITLLPYTTNASTIKYNVQSGDSLWKISQKFNTSISKITSDNSLDSSSYLYVGQTLIVDNNNASSYIKHTVVSGESLWRISNKYSVTIDAIKKTNNLTNDMLYIGQILLIPSSSSTTEQDSQVTKVETTNYKVAFGDNLWSIAKKFNTSMYAIKTSNMLSTDILMPGQVITVPVNSTKIVKPEGIVMMKRRTSDKYGDLYDWENARRLFTVGTVATLIDIKTGIYFDVKYYGGSNHSDVVPLTKHDTEKMKQLFTTWSWSSMRPMVLHFKQGNTGYQLAVSLTGMPHSTTDIYDNGVDGHFDMYFYNSTSHNTNKISTQHQKNVITANGQ